MDDSGSLHCPDYSEDVTLRKVKKKQDDIDAGEE